MTRFVKPRFFEPKQQEAVESALRRLSIGDAEGRRIFVLALEYELAEYEKSAAEASEQQSMPAGTEMLSDLGSAAAEISGLLSDLVSTQAEALCDQLSTTDPFSRRFDRDYVAALAAENNRVAAACREMETQPVSGNRGLGVAESHFIALVAQAYAECFEISVTTGENDPFFKLLVRIMEISGIDFPISEEVLAGVLRQEGVDTIP